MLTLTKELVVQSFSRERNACLPYVIVTAADPRSTIRMTAVACRRHGIRPYLGLVDKELVVTLTACTVPFTEVHGRPTRLDTSSLTSDHVFITEISAMVSKRPYYLYNPPDFIRHNSKLLRLSTNTDDIGSGRKTDVLFDLAIDPTDKEYSEILELPVNTLFIVSLRIK
ncbi:MAG: hypothetical protein WCF94_03780 [bacterium]